MDQGQSARLLQAAKARGVTTSFDLIAPNEETLELLRPLLPSVDYFMPSLEEAAFLSGETQPEAIGHFFLALGVGTCILKDGENGSWLIGRDGGPQHIAPWPVEAVDTTGCGDSYCGGFIAALARGLSVKAACDVASAVAALVATGMGSDAGEWTGNRPRLLWRPIALTMDPRRCRTRRRKRLNATGTAAAPRRHSAEDRRQSSPCVWRYSRVAPAICGVIITLSNSMTKDDRATAVRGDRHPAPRRPAGRGAGHQSALPRRPPPRERY